MTGKVRIGTGILAAIVAAAPLALRASGQDAPEPAPAVAPASAPAPAAPIPATPEQVGQVIQTDINRLAAILVNTGPRSSADQREQAAERLLSYRNADGSLNNEASRKAFEASQAPGPQNLDVRRAVARALLALPEPPDPQFLEPLRGLLADAPQDAAPALARYAGTPQAQVALDVLIDFGGNPRTTPFSRSPAVTAVGAFGDRRAGQFLIDLLRNSGESDDVRSAAMDGLINLTGYEQNGHDADRWLNWWQVAAARPANEWAASVPQAARSYNLARKGDDQTARIAGLLAENYRLVANDAKVREALELTWLRDASTAVRIGAANIASQQTLLNRPLGRDVIEQLRSMISDASPDVRRLVVSTLNNSSDTASTGLLIAQLTVERNPEVKRQIALALGKFHQVASIPWLLNYCLDDPNPRVFTAAADALKGEFATVIRNDPAAAAQVTQAVHDRLNRLGPNDSERLAALLTVAANLGLSDPQLLQAYETAVADPNQPVAVRIAGAHGLGAATGRDRDRAAERLVGAMSDPDKAVVFEAIRELANVGTLSAVKRALINKVDPSMDERDKSIREAAWQTLLKLAAAPEVKYREVINLADTAGQWRAETTDEKKLRSQRRVAMLELAVPKLERDRQQPGANVAALDVQLADLHQNIGDEYYNLGAWDRARANYTQALDVRQQQANAPPSIMANLAERIERCFLAAGRYKEGVAFAGKQSAVSDAEKAFMESLIRNEVDRLVRDGKLREANQLADEALQRMDPPLDRDVAQQLKDYQRDINQRLSSQGKQGAAQPVGFGGQTSAGIR